MAWTVQFAALALPWVREALTYQTTEFMVAGAVAAGSAAAYTSGRIASATRLSPDGSEFVLMGAMTFAAAFAGSLVGPYWIPAGAAFALGFGLGNKQ